MSFACYILACLITAPTGIVTAGPTVLAFQHVAVYYLDTGTLVLDPPTIMKDGFE